MRLPPAGDGDGDQEQLRQDPRDLQAVDQGLGNAPREIHAQDHWDLTPSVTTACVTHGLNRAPRVRNDEMGRC